jgi:hypothetical protein
MEVAICYVSGQAQRISHHGLGGTNDWDARSIESNRPYVYDDKTKKPVILVGV